MTEEPTRGISRRTLAKGVAWSVPAVAVASAVPAYAASPPPGKITLTGEACKLPGGSAAPFNDGAVYLATIANSTALPITIEITGFTRGATTKPGSQVSVVKLSTVPAGACCTNLGNSFSVPANSTGTYAIATSDWGSSGTAPLSIAYEVDGVAQPDATGTDPSSLNPIPGGNCGTGGSCTDLTVAQRLCVTRAVGPASCTTGDCS